MKQKIVLATGNQGKVREMADVLADFGFEVIAQTDLGIDSPEETGLTFVENAILKARYAAEKSSLPAIADDSGLVVDALNGAPGLYSARYAGVDGEQADAKNREKLLAELANVPTEHRSAQFLAPSSYYNIQPIRPRLLRKAHVTVPLLLKKKATMALVMTHSFSARRQVAPLPNWKLPRKRKFPTEPVH